MRTRIILPDSFQMTIIMNDIEMRYSRVTLKHFQMESRRYCYVSEAVDTCGGK